MAKKPVYIEPVLIFKEKFGMHKVLFWLFFGLPGFYYLYLFLRNLVQSVDAKYISVQFRYSAILLLVMGIIIPWIVRSYYIQVEIYNDGIYITTRFIFENSMGLRFKNLSEYYTVESFKQFLYSRRGRPTRGRLRALILTLGIGIMLINKEGEQFLLPTYSCDRIVELLTKKDWLLK